MPDRNDRDVPRCTMPPDPEQARRRFAASRASDHAVRELYLLELAVRAPDDDSARQLELYAHEAYCDAEAITKEHDLES
jgi:hypothetical protein